jgi:dihydroorotate dehydrogenase (fumarate)
VEERYVELVEAVRAEITIPLAVKIGPFFSSVGHMAHRLVAAGADGLVLFNRFMQPDIDLENLRVDPSLHLSTSDELRLPLRWIAILRGHVHASIAATTGVHTGADVLKVLLAGADVAMMASALLHEGPDHITTVLREVVAWLEEHEYESIEQMKGSMSQANIPNPVAYARANYAQLVTSFVSPYDWRMAEPEGEIRA